MCTHATFSGDAGTIRCVSCIVVFGITIFCALASCMAEDLVGYYLDSGQDLSEDKIQHVQYLHFVRSSTEDPRQVDRNWDEDLLQLRNAENLEILIIGVSKDNPKRELTPAGLENLVKLKRLSRLEFPYMEGADEKMEVISRIPSLEHLLIQRSELSQRGMKHIARMQHLSYLELEGAKIDSSAFESVSFPPSLTHLGLNNTRVDASIIDLIPPTITHLTINTDSLDKSAIVKLTEHKHLKVLQISSSQIPQSEMQKLRDALTDTRINDGGFPNFVGPRLRSEKPD